MARLGFALSGGLAPRDIVDCVRLADELGYESAWIAEGHGGDQVDALIRFEQPAHAFAHEVAVLRQDHGHGHGASLLLQGPLEKEAGTSPRYGAAYPGIGVDTLTIWRPAGCSRAAGHGIVALSP